MYDVMQMKTALSTPLLNTLDAQLIVHTLVAEQWAEMAERACKREDTQVYEITGRTCLYCTYCLCKGPFVDGVSKTEFFVCPLPTKGDTCNLYSEWNQARKEYLRSYDIASRDFSNGAISEYSYNQLIDTLTLTTRNAAIAIADIAIENAHRVLAQLEEDPWVKWSEALDNSSIRDDVKKWGHVSQEEARVHRMSPTFAAPYGLSERPFMWPKQQQRKGPFTGKLTDLLKQCRVHDEEFIPVFPADHKAMDYSTLEERVIGILKDRVDTALEENTPFTNCDDPRLRDLHPGVTVKGPHASFGSVTGRFTSNVPNMEEAAKEPVTDPLEDIHIAWRSTSRRLLNKVKRSCGSFPAANTQLFTHGYLPYYFDGRSSVVYRRVAGGVMFALIAANGAVTQYFTANPVSTEEI